MRKDLLILLIVLIPAAILMLFVARRYSSNLPNLASNTPYPTVSNKPNEVTEIMQITPASSGNIEVLLPLTGDSVKSGFAVKGNARTFESTVNIRLLDSSGIVLTETVATANAPDAGQFGPFEKTLTYQTNDLSGELQVFQYSAKDGSEIDKVTIPLAFAK